MVSGPDLTEAILKKMAFALQELLYEIYESGYEGFADIKLNLSTHKKNKNKLEQEFDFSVHKYSETEEGKLPKLDKKNCRRYHFKPTVGIKRIEK